MNRRDFIQLMGLASSASLLNSCGLERQTEKLIPYLVPPEDGAIPGQAVYYHTTCTECPAGCGISAKVMDHRPVKLEGIPGHPINDGALCMRGQASLSRLYHPERLKKPLRKDEKGNFSEIGWDDAYSMITDALRAPAVGRTGLGGEVEAPKNVYLSGRTTGSLSALIDHFCSSAGVERLPEFEPISHSAIREANKLLFDRPEIPTYRIEDADFLLTVGADILETFVSPVSHAVQFGRARRRPEFTWYHVEPHVSLTGLQSKKRIVVAPGGEVLLLAYLLGKVLKSKGARIPELQSMVYSLPNLSPASYLDATGLMVSQLDEIADQLLEARRPLVIAGGVSTMQSPGLQAAVLCGVLQWTTGMIGTTIDFNRAEDYDGVGSMNDMSVLNKRLEKGEIGVIFMSRTDPAANLPDSYHFTENLQKAKLRVGLSDFMTETTRACDVVMPLSHSLEAWGDAEIKRGITTAIQPAVEPLFDTRSEGDILIQLLRGSSKNAGAGSYQEYVFKKWSDGHGERGAEELLTAGYVARRPRDRLVSFNGERAAYFLGRLALSHAATKPVLYVTPSIRAFDGRSRVLPLLSEVPDPLTTISYGAWLSIAEGTASELGIRDRAEVEVSMGSRSIRLPVKVQPGLGRGIMMLARGVLDHPPVHSDEESGEAVARFDQVAVKPTGRRVSIPILAGSTSQEGRGVIPDRRHETHAEHGAAATLYPKQHYEDYRWGMAIDLELCIGCSACATACYVENNVPVVGPVDHLKGREMSWLRIEPWYEEYGVANFQPMLCQHCSSAPCESVCPVYATYHNSEGLNAQIYNRCVGTRYCSNNCPYKVRRFNWFDYKRPRPSNLMVNPDVSVRGRGVMEKCTFCVQRIRRARYHAKDEERKIRDGEVVTACQQACPTQAIAFGNLLDENSEVSKLAKSNRAHRVFEHLGTGPAVHYLRNEWKEREHEG